MVFGDHDAHGSSRVIAVGPPGGLSMGEGAVEGGEAALEAARPGAG